MKKFSKILVALLLATTATLGLVGCGDQDDPGNTPSGTQQGGTTTPQNIEQVNGKEYKYSKSEVVVPNHTPDQKSFISNQSDETYDELMNGLKDVFEYDGDGYFQLWDGTNESHFIFSNSTNKIEFYKYDGTKYYPSLGENVTKLKDFYYIQDGENIRFYNDLAKSEQSTIISAVAKNGFIEINITYTAKMFFKPEDVQLDFELFTVKTTAIPGKLSDIQLDKIVANKTYGIKNPTYGFVMNVDDSEMNIFNANKAIFERLANTLTFSFNPTTKTIKGISSLGTKYSFEYSYKPGQVGEVNGEPSNEILFDVSKTSSNAYDEASLCWSKTGKKLYVPINSELLGATITGNTRIGFVCYDVEEI